MTPSPPPPPRVRLTRLSRAAPWPRSLMIDKSRLPHLLALARRRPRLTWRDVPNLLAGVATFWLWVGLNWAAWAFLWSVIR